MVEEGCLASVQKTGCQLTSSQRQLVSALANFGSRLRPSYVFESLVEVVVLAPAKGFPSSPTSTKCSSPSSSGSMSMRLSPGVTAKSYHQPEVGQSSLSSPRQAGTERHR